MTGRLRYLLSKAKTGHDLWDIGCDHGQLAESALYMGNFPRVYFVDPLAHQIEAACRRVSMRFPKKAYFHCGSGESINELVTGSVVIAGMGGTTMLSILSVLHGKGILQAQRLILSPHKDVEQLQAALTHFANFQLTSATQFIERGRARPVLVYDHRIDGQPD